MTVEEWKELAEEMISENVKHGSVCVQRGDEQCILTDIENLESGDVVLAVVGSLVGPDEDVFMGVPEDFRHIFEDEFIKQFGVKPGH